MARTTIQQFRAALVDRAESTFLVRAYRRLARRPDIAAGMVRGDWGVWSDSPAAAA